MYKVVLASNSPRRKEILAQVGIDFVVVPSQVEEIITKEQPEEVVEELSQLKAMDIAEKIHDQALIIGADTIVAKDGLILGKPKDEEEAFSMLSMLQGSVHQVYTGVTVVIKQRVDEGFFTKVVSFHECTEVEVAPMTPEQIRAYIKTKEPMDKAGAYAIQGLFAVHIKSISGDYYNVVGFPISKFYSEMQRFGIQLI